MFFFAWMIGEGIIIYRWAKKGAPPTPGALLVPSGLFLGLAVLAEYQPARTVATAFAFAVDLAVLLQVVGKAPQQVTGWPPQQNIPQDAVLPNGLISASGPAGSAAAAPQSQAEKNISELERIQQILRNLPGIGGIT